VFGSWGSKQWLGPWRARGARACNRGLGAEPLARSRGRAPGGGLEGKAPLKLKAFWFLNVPRSGKILSKSIRLSQTSQCKRLNFWGSKSYGLLSRAKSWGSSCSLCSPCSNAHATHGFALGPLDSVIAVAGWSR